MDDNQVIQKCLDGDHDAFSILVRRYQSLILGISMRILGSREEARDVAQDAFVQAFKHLERFDRSRHFKTWLATIAVNRSLDRWRKHRSFLRYWKHKTSRFRRESGRHTTLEKSEIFSPLLKTLTPKEHLVLVMKLDQGYTSREIGEMLNCSDSTVRVYLYHAKRKLKQALEAAADSRPMERR